MQPWIYAFVPQSFADFCHDCEEQSEWSAWEWRVQILLCIVYFPLVRSRPLVS